MEVYLYSLQQWWAILKPALSNIHLVYLTSACKLYSYWILWSHKLLKGSKVKFSFAYPLPNTHTGEAKAALFERREKEEQRWGGKLKQTDTRRKKNQNKTWLVIYRRQAERGHDWCYCEDLSCSNCCFSCPQHPLCGSIIQKQPMFIGVWCRQNQKQGHGCFPASQHSAAPRLSSVNPVAFKSHFQKAESHEHREEVQQ